MSASAQIFSELDKTIKVLGMEKLIEVLRINRENLIDMTPEQEMEIQKIITVVCDVLGIALDEFHSGLRKNDRRFAIGICAFISEREVGLPISAISYLLKKPAETISRYKKDITLLSDRHPEDVKKLEKISRITEKLKQLKNVEQ